jgi:hypothetical protein
MANYRRAIRYLKSSDEDCTKQMKNCKTCFHSTYFELLMTALTNRAAPALRGTPNQLC